MIMYKNKSSEITAQKCKYEHTINAISSSLGIKYSWMGWYAIRINHYLIPYNCADIWFLLLNKKCDLNKNDCNVILKIIKYLQINQIPASNTPRQVDIPLNK